MLFFHLTFQTKAFIDQFFNRSRKWANSEISFVLFSAIGGLHFVLEEGKIFGSNPILLLVLLVLFSFLIWLLSKYFVPWLLWKFGKIWHGKGNEIQFRTLVSFALVPNIILEILSIYYHILDLKFDQIILNTPQIFALIFGVIYFRILIIGIAKIQQFTYGLALLNLLFPFGVLQLLSLIVADFLTF